MGNSQKIQGCKSNTRSINDTTMWSKMNGVALGIGQLVATANHGFKAVVKITITCLAEFFYFLVFF